MHVWCGQQGPGTERACMEAAAHKIRFFLAIDRVVPSEQAMQPSSVRRRYGTLDDVPRHVLAFLSANDDVRSPELNGVSGPRRARGLE